MSNRTIWATHVLSFEWQVEVCDEFVGYAEVEHRGNLLSDGMILESSLNLMDACLTIGVGAWQNIMQEHLGKYPKVYWRVRHVEEKGIDD